MKKIIILGICAVIVLSSCQKTPESQIVINKDSEKFDAAMEEKLPGDYSQREYIDSLPESWNESFEKYDGKVKMDIDADIVVSDAINYPVAAIEPYHVPIEQANKIVKVIFGEAQVYDAQMQRSKSQIEEQIIEVKAELKMAEDEGNQDDIEILTEVLEFLISEVKNAPDEVEAKKYSGEFTVDKANNYERHHITVRENPYDKESHFLEINNMIESRFDDNLGGSVTYENVFRYVHNLDDPNFNKLSYDENPIYNTDEAKAAIEIANKFLKECGIEDRVVDNMMARVKEQGSDEICAYLVMYTRKFNNITIPAFVQLGGSMSSNIMGEEEFIAPFNQEHLVVEVEDDKIVWFMWSDIYSVKHIEKADIRLMPFDEIMANAKIQLSSRNAYLNESDIHSELYVDKIILTYAVEPVKDKIYEYRLIPVWAFYGGHDYGDGYELQDGTILKGKCKDNKSLLTINAIDGSIISGQ